MITTALEDIKKYPYWRINFRTSVFRADLIPSIDECRELVQKTQVRFRGWPYPYLSQRSEELDFGNDYIGSVVFSPPRHEEYWRLYQSGQFIHYFNPWEIRNSE